MDLIFLFNFNYFKTILLGNFIKIFLLKYSLKTKISVCVGSFKRIEVADNNTV